MKSEEGRQITEDFSKKNVDAVDRPIIIEVPGQGIFSFRDWVSDQTAKFDTTTLIQSLELLVENPPRMKFPSLRICPDQLIPSFNVFNQIDFPARKMIMAPWLEEGSLILLAAPPGVGKSLLVMEIAASCSEGTKCHEWIVAGTKSSSCTLP
jgi:hypothetical protein